MVREKQLVDKAMLCQLFVLPLLFCANAAIGGDEKDERFSAKAEGTANAKAVQIRAEIEKLPAHNWAGCYYAGDGLGVNTSILLAPSSGYVFEWHGCLGLYDRNYGSITEKNGQLSLTFAFKNSRDGFCGIAPDLIPISWGARRYLIPADDVVGFCNDINQGGEPRTRCHGTYLFRDGDEKKECSGKPTLPFEFQGYLLSKPVDAIVLTVGSSTTRKGTAGLKFKDTQLSLDAGTRKGLKIGMELVVIKPDHLVETVKITRVEVNRSDAIMVQIGEEESGPKVGSRVSTQAPWHARVK